VESVADGVWVAHTNKDVNAGWFVLGDEVIAVDSGSDAATAKELLGKIKETAGKPVRFVIVTHAHGDHGGGLSPFVVAGATVICQEHAGSAVAQLVSSETSSKTGVVAINDYMAFFGGSRRVAIYHFGPAHTQGDLVVWLPDDKVLFTGDIATDQRAPYMQSADVDPKGWEQVLTKLSRMDVDRIIVGHGPVGTKEALTVSLAYVHKVNELAAKMIAEDVPDNLIDAKLHYAEEGKATTTISPMLLGNVRAAIRAQKASAASASQTPAPTPKPVQTPGPPKKG
jgi:cyclase